MNDLYKDKRVGFLEGEKMGEVAACSDWVAYK
jgi:hypothetical protein